MLSGTYRISPSHVWKGNVFPVSDGTRYFLRGIRPILPGVVLRIQILSYHEFPMQEKQLRSQGIQKPDQPI